MQPICGVPARGASPRLFPGAEQRTPGRFWQPPRQRRQDQAIGRLQPWPPDCPAENTQLVAKEEEFNLTIAAIDLEHEHIDEEAQAAVEAGEDQERRAW